MALSSSLDGDLRVALSSLLDGDLRVSEGGSRFILWAPLVASEPGAGFASLSVSALTAVPLVMDCPQGTGDPRLAILTGSRLLAQSPSSHRAV